MSFPRPARPAATVLVAVALLVAGCAPGPDVTGGPHTPGASAAPPSDASAAPAQVPFHASAWPPAGSACDQPGYRGDMGRIEALSARLVRFTLCAPDGAFLVRLAHPALAVIDSASLDRLAVDRSSATGLAGTGPYRIDHWTPGDNVRLVRVPEDPAADVPTVVLRWASDPTARLTALEDASVDGIDAPGAAEVGQIATQPELAVVARDALATAYLGFGGGSAFKATRVRQAIAQAIDRAALVSDAFPAGSSVATHLVPCVVDDACGGRDWYSFNGPQAVAALDAAGFDLRPTYPLHLPDQPVAGLPDPSGVATLLATQLAANAGIKVRLDVMPLDAYLADLADGTLAGLYLGGIASTVADPGAFLGPLLGRDVDSTPAGRARRVAKALRDAVATPATTDRAAAFTRANNAVRQTAVVVPLAHPGSVAAYRADVKGAAASPLGMDPLGTFTPGDRKQLVFMQAAEPDGAYCADQAMPDAYRLCGLVLQGLYGYEPGTLTPTPLLAQRCDPDAGATVWTCRLRAGVTFHDGARLDAGDVLASFVAQWAASSPLRTRPGSSFEAWDVLFGGPVGSAP